MTNRLSPMNTRLAIQCNLLQQYLIKSPKYDKVQIYEFGKLGIERKHLKSDF